MRKIKLGIVGSGFGLYGLLPAFSSIKGCSVTAFCGNTMERTLKYCESIGLKNIYTDWRLMIQNEQLDALAIAVTPKAQYEVAKVAIEKGLDIFTEKPLAATLQDAQELVDLAKKYNTIHAVDFIFPEIETWQKAKQLIDDKTYGKITHIAVNWEFLSFDLKNNNETWKSNIADGGGAIAFYFSHTLHYLEFFAGKLSQIQTKIQYQNSDNERQIEVGVDLRFTCSESIKGHAYLMSNFQSKNIHKLSFFCEKGVIILENNKNVTKNFDLTIIPTNQDKIYFQNNNHLTLDQDERVYPVSRIAERFINSCKTRIPMSPSMVEGLRVQRLIEIIRKGN